MEKVAAIGDLNVDAIFVGPLPKLGQETVYPKFEMHIGGCAANFAVALSRLGGNVTLFAGIGIDALGHFLKEKLSKEKVKLGLTAYPQTGITVIHTSEDRAFSTFTGANEKFNIYLDRIEYFDHVHLTSPFLTPSLDHVGILKKARELGVRTSLTTGDFTEKDTKHVWKLLDWVDVFIPNKRELKLLVNKPVEQAIKELPCKTVAATLGSDGALVYDQNKLYTFPAPAVKVIDTTGAGDVFTAAFVRMFDQGIEEAGKFAVKAASWKVQGVGHNYPRLSDLL